MSAVAEPGWFAAGLIRPLPIRGLLVDAGGAVAFVLLAVAPLGLDLFSPGAAVVTAAAVSIAVRRLAPGAALALAWATAALQVSTGERPSVAQVATVVVLYSVAAYGSRIELWLSAASVVVGGASASPYLAVTGARFAQLYLAASVEQRLLLALLPLAVLGSGWLAGFAVRSVRSGRLEAASRSAAETRADAAQEAAEIERVRSAMARDVHDVIGHSLAVIIAQADAAELVADPERRRRIVMDIARTARSSLDEVRGVLDRIEADEDVSADERLDAVLARVRETGAPLQDVEVGAVRELAPAAGLVARRVLQEMLTNALRHGDAGGAIGVTRSWQSSALVIRVANRAGRTDAPGAGRGTVGMRARLATVGGGLVVAMADGVFTATATIPYGRATP